MLVFRSVRKVAIISGGAYSIDRKDPPLQREINLCNSPPYSQQAKENDPRTEFSERTHFIGSSGCFQPITGSWQIGLLFADSVDFEQSHA